MDECFRKIKNKCEAKIIYSLRSKFKLSILIEATKFTKSTYMYWQNRFNIENPNKNIEEKIKSIFEIHCGGYGYR